MAVAEPVFSTGLVEFCEFRTTSCLPGNCRKRFRWIYFIPPKSCFGRHHEIDQSRKDQAIPLFLGADVLSACSVSVKHQYRHHNKYAKFGLATKVTMNGMKLPGINSPCVWFYSIQGIFKAVFEMGEPELQKDLLTQFKDMWLDRYSDPLLPENMENLESLQNCEHPKTLSQSSTEQPDSQCSDGHLEGILQSTQSQLSSSVTTSANKDENYITGKIQNMLAIFQQHINVLNRYEDPGVLNILKTYASLLEEDILTEKHQFNYALSDHEHLFLCIICEWLGKKFHNFQETIDHRAEQFKVDHITNLDQLPPPHEIIDSIFPKCMNVLMSCWMTGESQGFGGKPHKDRTCTSPKKKIRTDYKESEGVEMRRDVWQFIQIILEFANNTLISGVAHVVYSRLIQS